MQESVDGKSFAHNNIEDGGDYGQVKQKMKGLNMNTNSNYSQRLDSNTFTVGNFDQFPEKSHDNLSKFWNYKVEKRIPYSRWISVCDDGDTNSNEIINLDKIKNEVNGIPVGATIDKYPFLQTFDENNKAKECIWQLESESESELPSILQDSNVSDSVGSDIPYLTRILKNANINISDNTKSKKSKSKSKKKSKSEQHSTKSSDSTTTTATTTDDIMGMKQELLIWRDYGSYTNSYKRMNKLLNIYKPDCIIVAVEPNKGAKRLKSYSENTFQKILNFFSFKIMFKLLPNRWGRYWLMFTLITQSNFSASWANETAIEWTVKQNKKFDKDKNMNANANANANANDKTRMIFGDWPSELIDSMRALAIYLDMYQSLMFENTDDKLTLQRITKLISKNDIKDKKSGKRLPEITSLLSKRREPHRSMMNTYRNEFLSLAVNECDGKHKRILAIVDHSNVLDIVNRLTGQVTITNHIKALQQVQVYLKNFDQHEYSTNSQANTNLSKDELDMLIKDYSFDRNVIQMLNLPLDEEAEKLLEQLN